MSSSHSLGLAEVVALWLSDQDIPAQVMDAATLGGFDGLTWLSRTAVSARGIEVWVIDPTQVPQALLLLEEHSAAQAARAAERAHPAADVELVCEECGQAGTFPGSASGKVQTCTRCGAYMDIPGDQDDWTAPDDEEEPDEA